MSNHVLTLHVLTYTPVIHRLNRSHIRQLLYLALYPPAPSFQNDGDTKNGKDAGLLSSPSKLHAKHQNSIMIPTPPATNAAQDLLMSFSRTNTPESLFRALPSYVSSGTDNTFGDTQQNISEGDEYEDSTLARQSRRIKEARNCWEILKDGFIQPKVDLPTSPRPRRRKTRHNDDDDESDIDIPDMNELHIVAAHAWPVLHWIVSVLEKDEDVTEGNGQGGVSILFP